MANCQTKWVFALQSYLNIGTSGRILFEVQMPKRLVWAPAVRYILGTCSWLSERQQLMWMLPMFSAVVEPTTLVAIINLATFVACHPLVGLIAMMMFVADAEAADN